MVYNVSTSLNKISKKEAQNESYMRYALSKKRSFRDKDVSE
jgi:hypothetical protein